MQNKYDVIGIVGEGAYGIVYKCQNKETKEYVAIKKFKEVEDELVKKTMKRELKVLQLLKHENCVEFKEAFKRKNNLFLVFEFVDRNLLELIEEKPKGLEPELIRNFIYQLCSACNYLHKMNIIHRDIKPENLLINNNNQLKLCDFGFARKVNNLTFSNCIQPKRKEQLTDYVATRWYRAPELLITGGIYGPEVDFWAIGCIMGEIADGNPLFPGENELDQLHCIQKILGNFPDYLIDMFYCNPIFFGRHLLNIEKPETIEKRYMGKLSNCAISFMKGLLEIDPKKRLCGDKVFSHPYFNGLKKENSENLTNDSEKTMNYNGICGNSNRKLNISTNHSTNVLSNILKSNTEGNINASNMNTNTNTIVKMKTVDDKKNNITKQQSKIINNTTINIINYNNYNTTAEHSPTNANSTTANLNQNSNSNTSTVVSNTAVTTKKGSQNKIISIPVPIKDKKEISITLTDTNTSTCQTNNVNRKRNPDITPLNVVNTSPNLTEGSSLTTNKSTKDKKNIMAMTMTNKFPQKYQKNIIKTSPSKNSNLIRKSYESQKEKEFQNNKKRSKNQYINLTNNNNYNEYLTGYKTFYSKKAAKDKYNYPINTTGNLNSYYRPIIEEEEDEYNKMNSKNEYAAPIQQSEKNKYLMYLNNHNVYGTYDNGYKKSNSKNKNNTPIKNYKNHKNQQHSNVYLPVLNKNNNNNYNNITNTNFGYYSNIKKFQHMIGNK